MIIKGILDEDFVNYKEPSMFIAFPNCTFKCEKDCGQRVCQNSTLASAPSIFISENEVIERYINNPITSSVVLGGLEPFDSFPEMANFIRNFRLKYHCNDNLVIYTGYTEDEIKEDIEALSVYKNIIIKFGRFVPNQEPHYDEVLGVMLTSDNQYAKKIS